MTKRTDCKMVVSGITRRTADGYTELSAQVNCEPARMKDTRIWYRVPEQYGEYVTERADPFVAAMLFPAMYFRCPLVLEGLISEELLSHCSQAMKLFEQWFYDYKGVEIIPQEVAGCQKTGSETGCFFSGGADSFFSVFRNFEREKGENRIKHLLHVEGFEIPYDSESQLEEARRHLRVAAAGMGLNLITMSSNLRQATPREVTWYKHHGAGLGSVALFLGAYFKRIYVPSAYTYAFAIPDATHALLDPLWSNGAFELIHDGCDYGRAQKISRYVARSEVALKHLRVCLETGELGYNCGRCRKCLFTMLMLEIAGVLEKAETFSTPIDYERVGKLDVNYFTNAFCIDDILETFGEEYESNPAYQAVSKLGQKKRKYAWLHRLKLREGRYYTDAVHYLAKYALRKWIRDMDRYYMGSFLRQQLKKIRRVKQASAH